MKVFDLVVIGGGTSGFVVATGALRAGLQVLLIEKNHKLGGLALHTGCVPSKTLLQVARTAVEIKNSVKYGLDSVLAPIELGAVNNYVNQIVEEISKQDAQNALVTFAQLGGSIIYGSPKFIDEHVIEIEERRIYGKKIVLATGSRPLYPSIKGLDNLGYVTNENVFAQQKLWEDLVILGGKPIAVEFAQAFARLGVKVTLVVRGDSIMPQEDPELVSRIHDVLLQEGIAIYLNTELQTAYAYNNKKAFEFLHDSGETIVLLADEILVALGRRPNVEGLGLESAGIEYASDGIVVDQNLRTNKKHIFALGDVIRSPYKLTNVAEYQASVVLSNLVFKYPMQVKYTGFPYVVFTDPEYAHVGLTEQMAKEQGYKKIAVFRFDFKELDSAIINNARNGLIKIVTSRGRVIGAMILGQDAGNLLGEWSLAIKMRLQLKDIASTLRAYPTMAQASRRVANKQVVKELFNSSNRWLAGLFQRGFLRRAPA